MERRFADNAARQFCFRVLVDRLKSVVQFAILFVYLDALGHLFVQARLMSVSLQFLDLLKLARCHPVALLLSETDVFHVSGPGYFFEPLPMTIIVPI